MHPLASISKRFNNVIKTEAVDLVKGTIVDWELSLVTGLSWVLVAANWIPWLQRTADLIALNAPQ